MVQNWRLITFAFELRILHVSWLSEHNNEFQIKPRDESINQAVSLYKINTK